MFSSIFSVQRWDRRTDRRSSIEIERALCMIRLYGTRYGAAYLFTCGIRLDTALRVLLSVDIRNCGNDYAPEKNVANE
jgi:hypothetical protein